MTAIASGSAPPILTVLAYALFISTFGVCLGNIIKSESIFLGITVIGFLCTAVLGGVFVDVGGLLPQLDVLKYLFATYYFMEGMRGSGEYVVLAGVAVVLASGNIFRSRVQR
jgi:hypothetical protein